MIEKIVGIFTFDNTMFMLKGAGISLLIATLCLIFGTIIGMVIASFKISKNKILRVLGSIYVEIIRGTPMLLQLMFFYLGIPSIYLAITGNGLDVPPVALAIIAISMNSGAYVAELIRGTINGIDKGQWEAGLSLGLSYQQTLKMIIMPQVFKRITIPLANEYITLIKDSSLGSVIGVVELLQASKIIGTNYYNYVYPLVGAAVFYLIITLTISYFTNKLEMRMSFSD